jgi:hypothetical protein
MAALDRVGTPQQVGLMAGAAVTPGTFARSLSERSWTDQGLVTGLTVGSTYLATLLAQDAMDVLGEAVGESLPLPPGTSSERRHLLGTLVVNLAAVPVGLAATRLPVRDDEPIGRSAARQLGWRLGATGLMGAVQTAVGAAAGSLAGRGRTGRLIGRVPVAVPAGLGLALVVERQRQLDTPPEPGEDFAQQRPLLGLAAAAGVVGGLAAASYGESALASRLGSLGARFAPGSERAWRLIAHAGSLAALGVGVTRLWGVGMRRIEAGATTYEPVLDETARDRFTGPTISGGPESLTSWESLGREGRRHAVLFARPTPLPPGDRPEGMPEGDWSIPRVMGVPAVATPIQVYVGLDARPTVRERVDLALDEMDRTDAWSRSVLMLASPTGSGYVNYIATNAVQYFTLGDCATVTMQYSKRPSPLSLTKVSDAREQNRLLWMRILSRLRDVPREDRPKVVVFGESLGAHTSQDAFLHWGTLGPQALGLDRALWIGTPSGSKWSHEIAGADRYDADPDLVAVVNDFGQLEALGPERRARLRYVLLSHDNDGVTKFGADLLARRPSWLGPDRPRREEVPPFSPRGIPESMRWRPLTTFFQSLVDMKNAQIPGAYRAWAHDYRPDLPTFIREVYDLPATDEQLARVSTAVQEREEIREKLFQ